LLGVGAPPLVEELAITLAAAALFGYIAQRIGLVSIVGSPADAVACSQMLRRKLLWRSGFPLGDAKTSPSVSLTCAVMLAASVSLTNEGSTTSRPFPNFGATRWNSPRTSERDSTI
jgi:hypothetical protein